MEGKEEEEEVIKKNNQDHYYDWVIKEKKKFTTTEIEHHKKFKVYDAMQFAYKKNDKNYIIYDLNGLIDFETRIEDCYKKKNEIVKEIGELFGSLTTTKYNKKKHPADPTGKSTVTAFNYWFPSGDLVGVKCFDWSKEKGYRDNLRIQIKRKEFNDWLE